VDVYNYLQKGKKINLKGILVGNGIMSFLNGALEESSIEYMVNHDFIDPDLIPYYRGSCMVDSESAGCRYFRTR
jgi:hypothetical protein